MLVDVVMPKMGESIQEGRILRWMKKPGDKIAMDETILEISTDKVDSEIPAPSAGFLSKIVVPEGETVEVGTVIAVIETEAAALKVDRTIPSKTAPAQTVPKTVAAPVKEEITAQSTASSSRHNSDRFYSPLVRTIADKEGVALEELDNVAGSGINGRVTKDDIIDYLSKREVTTIPTMAVPLHRVERADLQKKYPSPEFEIIQMDNVQVRMAEHMVQSVRTSPHVEAISECDVTRIVAFRDAESVKFETQEGFKLTYTPFVVDAAVRALKDFPIVNSSVEGDKIILKKSVNFGIAVAAPNGLIVPVIKRADEKNFLGLARSINDLAVRTRAKHLNPEDIQGGTFTLTNYGVFGNIIGTPIINQPQVAILGVGAFTKRPIVQTDADGNDSIAIRSMVYLTLAFDHRIIDGAIGGQFLAKIVANLQQYDFSRVF